MSYILKVRDENGNFVGIPAITGEDGFSPIVSITEITGGHRITITDANGSQTFDVMDGVGGSGGSGTDGKDGYSPTITVTNITGGHRLTITDVNGTNTVDVMDGKDGAQGPKGDTGATGPAYTLTDADKSELVSAVIAQLPVYDGEVVAV